MIATSLRDNVYAITVNDRTTDLFEGLWPISQEGVSYNSYLIQDEKTALIDLTKEFKTDELFDNVGMIKSLKEIDYLVVNHMEPDHTGAMKALNRLNPDITILCTPKARPMIENYYGITENVREVSDGEEISLGKKTLKFFHTPFVHWPETMMTYLVEEKILFSCDGFGGYGALTGAIFDDQIRDLDFYIKESLRYYTNIVAKFTKPVLNAIEKLADYPIEIIAPSHGLIWRGNPGKIVELYQKWSEYGKGDNEKGVTLLYGTMYGNTETMMNYVARGLGSEGVPVDIFDVARTHMSYILPSLWVNRGVIIGAPTYEGSLYPAMSLALEEASIKRVLNKKAAYFGSFGWSGGALRQIQKMVEPLKWEILDTLEFPGGPTDKELEKAFEFGAAFGRSIKA
ncbi:FprA family A-type flavoprotein [Marispirochaeta aestuarii]|uniref:FprA family A-type flavoprotein n=1 Tax=Marispirochaeta aestuarii TaxID=1963862 RepID=UPI0029C70AD5|nr:FprA family A-type flavoprotein [Marispirochaeta aestuarii]